MSLTRFWLFLAVALPVLAAVLAPLSTVDLAYQLRAGSEILVTGSVPTIDTWTFTAAGQPWVDQQWGAQAVLALAEGVGSWTGLVLVRALLTGIIFACLAAVCRRRGLDARTTALLVVVAFVVAAPAMALRPQLFGMACFAIVLLLVTERRRRPWVFLLVPLVVAAWANLHGSFFLGPLVLGLAWLEDVHDGVSRVHRALFVAVAAAVAACLTPTGPWVWAYAIDLTSNAEVTARVTEWQPTSLRTPAGLAFFASLFATAAVIARRGQVVAWPTLAWLGVFAVIGIYAGRGVAWWPLAATVAVAGTIIPARPDPARPDTRPLRRVNIAVACLLVAVGLVLLPAWRPLEPTTRTPLAVLTDAPAGITAALRDAARPGDHVFNPQAWGSWFEYALPDFRYAVDSRIEFFSVDVWTAYDGVLAGREGWEATLDAWDVALIVAEDEQTDLVQRLVGAGWQQLYADHQGSVLQPPRS